MAWTSAVSISKLRSQSSSFSRINSIIISRIYATQTPLLSLHNIIMQGISHSTTTPLASETKPISSIRLLRQKLEATRGKALNSFTPLALNHPGSEKEGFELQIQEEREICDRAVQRLKEGSRIVIDWTTRSNFRVRPELPKLKTEPIELMMGNKRYCPSIESKRLQLARLLHEKNKKFYMKSRTEHEEEVKLFGTDHKLSLRNSHIDKMQKKLKRSRQKRLSEIKQTIESAQNDIMEHCKLTQLKEELRIKFQQIRQLYNSNSCSGKRSRRPIGSP